MYPKIRFKCTLCGECCKRYWIPITHIDIARIVKYGGYDVESFIALFNKDMTTGWDYPEIRMRDGVYYLILKKKVDGTCIFNEWVNGNLICKIHKFKPLTCRFYPFVYWVEDNIVKFEVYNDAIEFCPGLGKGVYNDFKWELEALKESLKAKEEFKKVVDRWNKLFEKGVVKGTFSEFVKYLRNVVDLVIDQV